MASDKNKYYEYSNYNGAPLLNELAIPRPYYEREDPDVFMIRATSKKDAFNKAMAHIYDGLPLSKTADGYLCVI